MGLSRNMLRHWSPWRAARPVLVETQVLCPTWRESRRTLFDNLKERSQPTLPEITGFYRFCENRLPSTLLRAGGRGAKMSQNAPPCPVLKKSSQLDRK